MKYIMKKKPWFAAKETHKHYEKKKLSWGTCPVNLGKEMAWVIQKFDLSKKVMTSVPHR
jgi:hypothetical protein